MRVFWWQGGLHLEPGNDTDRAALAALRGLLLSLEGVEIKEGPVPRRIASDGAYEQSVIDVHVGEKVIT